MAKIKSVITLTFVPDEADHTKDIIDIGFKAFGVDKKAESSHEVHLLGSFLAYVAEQVLEGEAKVMELMDEYYDRYESND